MEAKLIKKDNVYYITHDPTGWYIGDTDHEKVKNFKGEQGLLKLSLKNCQEIENGYDLDELADKYEYVNYKGKSKSYNIGFKHGFQKALEILGDKKYSEEDIKKAIDFGVQIEAGNIEVDYKNYKTKENQFIQSLQQTEWDVTYNPNEKDSDGCLILKRL